MKYFFCLILFFGLLFGCSKKEQTPTASFKPSFGNRNEVVLVIDDSLWVGSLGDSIRAHLAQTTAESTTTEPIFDLVQLDPSIFTTRAKTARNIVLFSIHTQHEFLLQKSVHATPQNFFFLRAKTKSDLLAMFKKRADSVISVFKASELNEETHEVVRTSTKELRELKEFFGCTLKIPDDYHLQVKSEFPFLWYQKDLSSGSVNLVLYEFPIAEIENNKGSVEEHLLQARNFIGKKFIKTAKDTAYITTNTKEYQFVSKENMLQMPAYRIVGSWETVNDYLKGPFISYAIRDEYYQRYLFVEGYVNNPLKNKRDQILEVEAIIKTINFNENGN
ncbi:DUF4837 family protein [Flavobacterium sp. CBA20B-1]|uniref:DUF4837 family protein n=1 Tax=unclassified Flavobacterium TaxID=196869 RepID=UPI002223F754|nr:MULTISPECIES: DUF4837 family protein [unclassified Flavobacterium]WCM41291.1 DUF4837 family protein [Flavobacterium sp. CBA20B-1]